MRGPKSWALSFAQWRMAVLWGVESIIYENITYRLWIFKRFGQPIRFLRPTGLIMKAEI